MYDAKGPRCVQTALYRHWWSGPRDTWLPYHPVSRYWRSDGGRLGETGNGPRERIGVWSSLFCALTVSSRWAYSQRHSLSVSLTVCSQSSTVLLHYPPTRSCYSCDLISDHFCSCTCLRNDLCSRRLGRQFSRRVFHPLHLHVRPGRHWVGLT